jgi:starch synthase (maltosyl-transferring)
LTFHTTDNPELICYSKRDPNSENRVVVVVNLDPNNKQSGWVKLQLADLGLEADRPYQMHDLLAGGHYLWHAGANFIALDPKTVPAHVFRIRQHVRREQDFDYFM